MNSPGSPFYSYHPRRAVTVNIAAIVILTTGGILLVRAGIWPLGLVMGIVVLKCLKDLAMESVIELREESPFLVYSRRTLFKRETHRLPYYHLKGAGSRITGMWRGNISEKLVLEAAGKEYLLHPHYSSRKPAAANIHRELARLRKEGDDYFEALVREEEAKEEKKERKAAGEKKPRVEKFLWCLLEMSLKCPGCDSPVPVNGPWENLSCTRCGEGIHLDTESWKFLLGGVRKAVSKELEPGQGSESMLIGRHRAKLMYGRMDPYCPVCKADLPGGKPEGGELLCSCGNSMEVKAPPRWFPGVFRGARCIAGATGSTSTGETQEPVTMTCGSCGGPISVTGDVRNPLCPHCGTGTFLPDDLWFHFNPAPVKKRWFVGFTAGATPD